MNISRTIENIIIMTVIYDELIALDYSEGCFNRTTEEIIEGIYNFEDDEYSENIFNGKKLNIADISPFVINSIQNSLKNYNEIKNAFIPYLRNWSWERIPCLIRAILVMSYGRYYYGDKEHKKIIINIAVNLAKRFFDDKQGKFINAILEKVIK